METFVDFLVHLLAAVVIIFFLCGFVANVVAGIPYVIMTGV